MAATADDRLHVFEEDGGAVSEVGERIIELVDGQRTVGEIAQVLTEEFEVEQGVALGDTVSFIELLVERHVLVV